MRCMSDKTHWIWTESMRFRFLSNMGITGFLRLFYVDSLESGLILAIKPLLGFKKSLKNKIFVV